MPSTVDAIRRRKKLNLLAATDPKKFKKALKEERQKREIENKLSKKKVPGFKKVIKKSFSKLKTLVFN
jgi:hypothetical protein